MRLQHTNTARNQAGMLHAGSMGSYGDVQTLVRLLAEDRRSDSIRKKSERIGRCMR